MTFARWRWRVAGVLAVALAAGCAVVPGGQAPGSTTSLAQPSGLPVADPSGFAVFKRHAVAAAHPLAAQAGLQMLRQGGTAMDAAVAVQLVLTLVEPQSSGIGGGAFLLHWDGSRLEALDGRETAPAEADERLFLQPDGKPMPFQQAVVGGRAVGVPGTVALLAQAHQRYGRLPWAQLFEPAIGLAEQGFAISARLHAQIRADAALKAQPEARAFFFSPEGEPLPEGYRLRNPALAAVFRKLAVHGPEAFYAGPVAQDMVQRVRRHPSQPGRLALSDLRDYTVKSRQALCTPWQRWRVCGFPPPSSGHLAVMQILGMGQWLGLGQAALDATGRPTEDFLHRYTEAARLAFADRAMFVADPDFVPAPGGDWQRLLDPQYLRSRAAQVGPRSLRVAPAGQPAGPGVSWAPQALSPEYGTSHFSIVDGEGRAVAMTTTIEAVWGSRLLADGGTGLPGGYLLNNELTDFSFAPSDGSGRPVANRVQPGKRPRSSMSPTLVFDAQGRLVMSAGSPGGAQIIHYTAKTLLGTLALGLHPQRVVALPNFGSLNGPTQLERGRFEAPTIEALKARGHDVAEIEMASGLQVLLRMPGGWSGAADPRREGVVLGD